MEDYSNSKRNVDVLDIDKEVDLLDVSEEIKKKCFEEFPNLRPEFLLNSETGPALSCFEETLEASCTRTCCIPCISDDFDTFVFNPYIIGFGYF